MSSQASPQATTPPPATPVVHEVLSFTETEELKHLDRAIARVRLGSGASALLFMALVNPVRFRDGASLAVVAVLALYAVAQLAIPRKAHPERFAFRDWLTVILDYAFLTVFVVASGENHQPFYPLFVFPAVMHSLRYGGLPAFGGIVYTAFGLTLIELRVFGSDYFLGQEVYHHLSIIIAMAILSHFGAHIRERGRAQRSEMRVGSLTDPLTGAFNRRYLDLVLSREWEHLHRTGRSLSVIMSDVFLFKLFNDSYGHLAGDHRLTETANLLKSSVRSTDSVVRYGGDEFLIIMPGATREQASEVLRRIEANLNEWNRIHLGKARPETGSGPIQPMPLTLTLAAYTTDHDSVADILKNVDKELYKAKDSHYQSAKDQGLQPRNNGGLWIDPPQTDSAPATAQEVTRCSTTPH